MSTRGGHDVYDYMSHDVLTFSGIVSVCLIRNNTYYVLYVKLYMHNPTYTPKR